MEFCKRNASVIASFLILIVLLLIPTGYEDAIIYTSQERAVGMVTAVDNSEMTMAGMIERGTQIITCELKDGDFAGQTVQATNMLSGSLEQDKIFEVGDSAFLLMNIDTGEVTFANAVDHYRVDKEALLAVMFAILLMLIAGKTGIRSILSFAITILAIWKILIPAYLNGYNPLMVGFAVTAGLTIIIISLVFGFDAMCVSAVTGSLTGTLVTLVLSVIFTGAFKIHGALMSGSVSLLYCGYEYLDLTQIFIASIFLGASGAVMDLAVDITAAVNEVVEKKPDITAIEAVKSGMNVGRAAMGTMTTTLLLAYSGSYVAQLMVFMAQGTPIDNILNYKYVSAEILHTLAGSFGLVSVAPLTALCAGVLLTRKMQKNLLVEPVQCSK